MCVSGKNCKIICQECVKNPESLLYLRNRMKKQDISEILWIHPVFMYTRLLLAVLDKRCACHFCWLSYTHQFEYGRSYISKTSVMYGLDVVIDYDERYRVE